jgi:hypothetical protein
MDGWRNERRTHQVACRSLAHGLEGFVYRSSFFTTVFAALLVGPPSVAAEAVGVVTILEGDALAIRGLGAGAGASIASPRFDAVGSIPPIPSVPTATPDSGALLPVTPDPGAAGGPPAHRGASLRSTT